jgi:hypothetical protein
MHVQQGAVLLLYGNAEKVKQMYTASATATATLIAAAAVYHMQLMSHQTRSIFTNSKHSFLQLLAVKG